VKLPLVLVACVLAGACGSRKEPGVEDAGARALSAPAPPSAAGSGYATVTGRAPAPSAVVILTPQLELAEPAQGGTAILDQNNQMFLPGILIARTGQPVTFANSDPELHNLNVRNSETKEQSFNVAIPTGATYAYTFKRDGFYDVRCDIHPAMSAVIVASTSPYAGVADEQGSFVFNDVPEGTYTLHIYAGSNPMTKSILVRSPTTTLMLDGDGS